VTWSVDAKNQIATKLSMYYINCHRTNHNVETYKSKEEPTITAIEATTQVGKTPRPLNHPCHICGIVGHKLMNYPRFGQMQSMFKDKKGQSTKSKRSTKVKMVIVLVNMVDVNVTTQNKTNEE
jgi:hypothetical protein